MTTIQAKGNPLQCRFKDSPHHVNGKRVVGEVVVFKLHRDGDAYTWYINVEGYRLSRTSVYGPNPPPPIVRHSSPGTAV